MKENNPTYFKGSEYTVGKPSPYAVKAITHIVEAYHNLEMDSKTLLNSIIRGHIATDKTTINKSEKAIAGASLYLTIRTRTQNQTQIITQENISDEVGCVPVTVRKTYSSIDEKISDVPTPTEEYIHMLATHGSIPVSRSELLTNPID